MKHVRSTILSRLIRSFSVAIVIPTLITAVVGSVMIYHQVVKQAQCHVSCDLKAAKEIYQHQVSRLQDVVRNQSGRYFFANALSHGDVAGLKSELARVRIMESFDILTLTNSQGVVVARSRINASTGMKTVNSLALRVLQTTKPLSGTVLMSEEELQEESRDLARQARMKISPTPRAQPSPKEVETSGMVIMAAFPVQSREGELMGVIYGGMLLNRNYTIVDKVKETVFKKGLCQGKEVGTATIFQGDLRISTNVKNLDGSRAITTRVSEEVARKVLDQGETWRGRAFVVNDWYISAYDPLYDPEGSIIGMLYVGQLERPYHGILFSSLCVFLSIALLGVILTTFMAFRVAHRISRPIHGLVVASQNVAQGDYNQKVEVVSNDEIGYLIDSFNNMILELSKTHDELQNWAETLEHKVEERTTELKDMQAHLIQTEKLAAVGKLAASVAHEINNPLTGVLTSSSLLLEDIPSDDSRKEDLQIIVDETLRCRNIIRGLLDFARQTQPHKEMLDLKSLVQSIFSLIKHQINLRNITIVEDVPDDLPEVLADMDQMRQVLINIIMNAAEAMGENGEIHISGLLKTEENHVELRFADTGPGIPEEIKSKLFEPFFSTKKKGTGLGLAIVYGILQNHGGTIHVEDRPGGGTIFVITFPIPEKIIDE